MQRQLVPLYQEFVDDLRAHLRQVNGLPGGIALWERPKWWNLLEKNGWQAPGWPAHLGGTGWDATQLHLWYRCCFELWPDYIEPPEIALLGPLLFDNSSALSARIRADILSGDAGCACAPTEGAVLNVDGAAVNGVLPFVAGFARARFLLAPMLAGETLAWGLIETEKLHASPARSAWGEDGHTVSVQGAELLDGCWFADLPAVHAQAAHLARSVVLNHLMQQVISNFKSQDLPLPTQAMELEVACEAYTAMEQRWLWASANGEELPFGPVHLTLQGHRLQTEIGDLLIDAFGYYALPQPDLMPGTNEPPPLDQDQHDVQTWLRTRGSSISARQEMDMYALAAAQQKT